MREYDIPRPDTTTNSCSRVFSQNDNLKEIIKKPLGVPRHRLGYYGFYVISIASLVSLIFLL